MVPNYPQKAGEEKDGSIAVVKVIRTDRGDDLLNYGVLPDSPYDSDNRIEELSEVSIITQPDENSANIRIVNVIWARKLVGGMEKDLELDIDVDMDGFPLSTNCFSNSINNISSVFPNVNIDISNISHSLSPVSLVGKGKRKTEDTVMVPQKCTKMDEEDTILSEEKKIGNGGQ